MPLWSGGRLVAFYKRPWVYKKGSLMCPASGSITKGVTQIPKPEASPWQSRPLQCFHFPTVSTIFSLDRKFSKAPKIFIVLSSLACPPPPVSMTAATGHRWEGVGAGVATAAAICGDRF